MKLKSVYAAVALSLISVSGSAFADGYTPMIELLKQESVKEEVVKINRETIKANIDEMIEGAKAKTQEKVSSQPASGDADYTITIGLGEPNFIYFDRDEYEIFTKIPSNIYEERTSGLVIMPDKAYPFTLAVAPPENITSPTIIRVNVVPDIIAQTHEIKLKDNGRRANTKAAEQHTPAGNEHVKTLTHFVKELAENKIPAGFSLRNPVAGEPFSRFCKKGISTKLGKVATSRDSKILIYAIKNENSQPIDLMDCLKSEDMAVSVYPNTEILGGETGELYAIQAKEKAKADKSQRSRVTF